MDAKISLKEAERKALRMIQQDGLFDILLGLMLLSLVLSAFLRQTVQVPLNYIPVIAMLVLSIPAYNLAKRSITTPRLGLVGFGSQRKRKINRARWVVIGIFAATMVVYILTATKVIHFSAGTTYWFVDAVFGVAIGTFFSLLAFSWDVPRMHLYGWLLGASLPVDQILEKSVGVGFPLGQMVVGFVMLAFGLVLLYRFLRQYPLPPEDGSHG